MRAPERESPASVSGHRNKEGYCERYVYCHGDEEVAACYWYKRECGYHACHSNNKTYYVYSCSTWDFEKSTCYYKAEDGTWYQSGVN